MKIIVIGITGIAIVIGTIIYVSSLSTTKSAPITPSLPRAVTSKPPSSKEYFYPISNYEARIQERAHGQYFTPKDKTNSACGKPFQGFHAGDDLETEGVEIANEVPIFSIAKGKILQIGFVNGYGGLVVQSSDLNDKSVTVYYGHMDLSSISLKPGDEVIAGEFIGNLGDECSNETDNARKHLHFAIRKGADVDVRGYIPTEAILSNWLNPTESLKELSASEPIR